MNRPSSHPVRRGPCARPLPDDDGVAEGVLAAREQVAERHRHHANAAGQRLRNPDRRLDQLEPGGHQRPGHLEHPYRPRQVQRGQRLHGLARRRHRLQQRVLRLGGLRPLVRQRHAGDRHLVVQHGHQRRSSKATWCSTDCKSWNSYRGNLRTSGATSVHDFMRVALHEFGHVLGLDHPDENGQRVTALMNSHHQQPRRFGRRRHRRRPLALRRRRDLERQLSRPQRAK